MLGCVLAVLVWNAAEAVPFLRGDETALWFFDVGQGDATFIRDAGGKDVLIDAGPDDSVLGGLSKAMPFWEREIDIVIITHFDADHFLGLFAVLGRYDVGEVWTTGAYPTTREGRRLLEILHASGIPLRSVAEGEEVILGKGRLSVIFPEKVLDGLPVVDKNNASVVGRFDCGHDIALLMGDAETETEDELLQTGKLRQAKLLKVGHHGSKTSSSSVFLDIVRPEQAVISSGARNRYGHPAPSVLMRLMERGAEVLRTDREGHMRFGCDGKSLRRY